MSRLMEKGNRVACIRTAGDFVQCQRQEEIQDAKELRLDGIGIEEIKIMTPSSSSSVSSKNSNNNNSSGSDKDDNNQAPAKTTTTTSINHSTNSIIEECNVEDFAISSRSPLKIIRKNRGPIPSKNELSAPIS